MTEVMPISCISCRRKKIKCNKTKPCNQCTRRRVECRFPSTFRNIKINDRESNRRELMSRQRQGSGDGLAHTLEDLKDRKFSTNSSSNEAPSQSSYSSYSDTFEQTPSSYKASSSSVSEKDTNEVECLRKEVERILLENRKLSGHNKDLKDQIEKFQRTGNFGSNALLLKQGPGTIAISGETSEMGEKYYGPQSSNFMIESFKRKLGQGGKDASIEPSPHLQDTKLTNDDSSLGQNRRKLSSGDQEDDEEDIDEDDDEDTLIKRSLLKKPLPTLLRVPSGLLSNSYSFYDLASINLQLIYKLVEYFFAHNSYYKCFISKQQVLEFLESYDDIKDKEWENDDDLLLLYMILLLLVQRLTPKEFLDLNLIQGKESSPKDFKKLRNYLTNEVLYNNFESLRHNLINESIYSIQAYILCTEWYFIDQKYEECWSMLYHTCSISYSVGLHVMSKLRYNDQNDEDQEEDDIIRYKVWFALRSVSGQICSVLGRPNPISLQVNSIVMHSSLSQLSEADLNKYKTRIMLKIGLGECLRLSNMMLIENFMIDFTVDDLFKLNDKFQVEISVLEWFASENYAGDEEIVDDPMFDESSVYSETLQLPEKIDRTNLQLDLIVFYINRAKIFEPFVMKFEMHEQAFQIVQNLSSSLLNFLNTTINFIENYFDRFNKTHLNLDTEVLKEAKFGKQFRVYYPFLNSFIYQGVIIVYTFLHYKEKLVINYSALEQQPIDYVAFMNELEAKLKILLHNDKKFESVTSENNKLWSSNITYLIRKTMNYINHIREKRRKLLEKAFAELKPGNFNESADMDQEEESEFFGFNLNDPFWITNPDNLPYYITSPSEESKSSPKYDMDDPKDTKHQSEYHMQAAPQQSSSTATIKSSSYPDNMFQKEIKTPDAQYGSMWTSTSTNPNMQYSQPLQGPTQDVNMAQSGFLSHSAGQGTGQPSGQPSDQPIPSNYPQQQQNTFQTKNQPNYAMFNQNHQNLQNLQNPQHHQNLSNLTYNTTSNLDNAQPNIFSQYPPNAPDSFMQEPIPPQNQMTRGSGSNSLNFGSSSS